MQVVRTSDFLNYDDIPSVRPQSRYPVLAFTPSAAVWHGMSPSHAVPAGADELWLKQVVVEVTAGLPLAQTIEVNTVLDRAVLDALPADCYRLDGRCWEATSQPTLNRTARSFAFTSPQAASIFGSALAQQHLSSETLQFEQSRRKRTSYTSFFGRGNDKQQVHDVLVDEPHDRTLEDMKSVKWMLFAARAFVMRFYGLAKASYLPRPNSTSPLHLADRLCVCHL